MNYCPKIISIAAVSGGGKTTITNLLQQQLTNSIALYFDDYDLEGSPSNICEWVETGADYDEWKLDPLIKDIQFLVNNNSLDYILLDYPFAYKHSKMREYIDLAIFIDTPLDIAMARRIRRDFAGNPMNDLLHELEFYLSKGRKAYLELVENVKPNSDLTIDGSIGKSLITNKIIEEIKIRVNFDH